ncbi:MAG TPA: carboxypeptidase-like regulatory domain-containing protein, partial [Flavitalea sp.]|nr:carboxypeptidase-like regulatory domain-containing protein [Flavitalea sp.]
MRITCLLLFLFALNVFSVVAQERQITGQVTGKENNQPLAGVSVIIAGTKKGTTTDADGNFR